MRIGYYIPAWPPGSVPNGIVTTLGHLGRVLRELGHEIFYITPHILEPLADEHVFSLEDTGARSALDSLRFKLNLEKTIYNRYSNAVAAAVNKLCAGYGIDIFQMEETQGWASTVIRTTSVPVVVRLHGPWHLNREIGPNRRDKVENTHRVGREGKAIFEAAAVTAPSESALALTTAFYGKTPLLSEVIPNPIYSMPESKRWKLDECDRDLMLFVGRFDQIKGADLVLKAFAVVAQERPSLRLLFVGPDVGLKSESGSPMRFEEFVASEIPPSVRARIEFSGALTRLEVEGLRTRAYATIVGSRYETFGNVVIEAMTFGCPIASTGVGGILEILTDMRNGLVAPVDANGLAAALTRLLDSPELAAKLGSQAARDCQERFDPKSIGRQTLEFYSTVIGRRKKRGTPCPRKTGQNGGG